MTATCLGCGDPAPWGEPCPRCGILAREQAAAVEFVVPGRPVPWARTSSRGGQRFTPKRQRDHGALVAQLAKVQVRSRMLDGPVAVELEFRYPNPQRPTRAYPRGDVDNLAKLVLDACQGILFPDDDYVVSLSTRKRYAPAAGTLVRCSPVPM